MEEELTVIYNNMVINSSKAILNINQSHISQGCTVGWAEAAVWGTKMLKMDPNSPVATV